MLRRRAMFPSRVSLCLSDSTAKKTLSVNDPVTSLICSDCDARLLARASSFRSFASSILSYASPARAREKMEKITTP